MKNILIGILITSFILYCMVFPREMALSVANGLSLWYHNVLPTLLPFSILSYIIIQSNLYHAIFSKMNRTLFKQSTFNAQLLYPLLFGYFFGFPIGAKILADLYETKQVNEHRLSEYTVICTQFGPAFIINYIGIVQLHKQLPIPILLLSIYAPSFLLLTFMLIKDCNNNKHLHNLPLTTPLECISKKKPVSRSYINFKIIDTGIINGFETMLRIAGYIVLFSILSDAFCQFIGNNGYFSSLVTGLLEVTTGVNQIVTSKLPMVTQYCAIIGIVSFGGMCGLFQVKAIMKNCPFHAITYFLLKLLCAFTSICIGMLCIQVMR